jgi:hypothetical protein
VARRKEKVECHEGCHTCCLKSDVPISAIEIAGMSWIPLENDASQNLFISNVFGELNPMWYSQYIGIWRYAIIRTI